MKGSDLPDAIAETGLWSSPDRLKTATPSVTPVCETADPEKMCERSCDWPHSLNKIDSFCLEFSCLHFQH